MSLFLSPEVTSAVAELEGEIEHLERLADLADECDFTDLADVVRDDIKLVRALAQEICQRNQTIK